MRAAAPHARPRALLAGGVEEHLREAIALNVARAPTYEAWGGRPARALSRALVRRERLLLPAARLADRYAGRYERAGVPLVSSLFVSMSGAPPLVDPLDPPPSPPAAAPDVRALGRRLRRAMTDGGATRVAAQLDHELDTLERHAPHEPMLRHLLESARRVAGGTQPLLRLAAERGLPSPERFLGWLLRTHLHGLGAGAALDRRARPLIARGIPILANDLPPIPPWPAP